ncbi:MAG: sigma-70 family RNA polymerase sigma factor [Nanoarchaeota archaeon]|nr:sigma-70 family RNA polymerase sigma factor [Nanoarchaeota archaeon]
MVNENYEIRAENKNPNFPVILGNSGMGRGYLVFSPGTRNETTLDNQNYSFLRKIVNGELTPHAGNNGFLHDYEKSNIHLTGKNQIVKNLAFGLGRTCIPVFEPEGGFADFKPLDLSESNGESHFGEQELFTSMHYYRRSLEKVSQELLNKGFSLSGTLKRVGQMIESYEKARDISRHLSEKNKGLIYKMAGGQTLSEAEFRPIGDLALDASINSFNYTQGFRFSSYACRSIKREFIKNWRERKRVERGIKKYAEHLIETGQEIPGAQLRVSPHEEAVSDGDLFGILDRGADYGLKDREIAIINLRFPRNGSKGLSLNEVGETFGLTKERIRQIQEKGLKKIREFILSEANL